MGRLSNEQNPPIRSDAGETHIQTRIPETTFPYSGDSTFYKCIEIGTQTFLRDHNTACCTRWVHASVTRIPPVPSRLALCLGGPSTQIQGQNLERAIAAYLGFSQRSVEHQPTFRRHISPPSSRRKNKPSRKSRWKQITSSACSSETPVDLQRTTRRYIPEDRPTCKSLPVLSFCHSPLPCITN
jgi:hypothetical protein